MHHPSRSVVKDLLSIGGRRLEPYLPKARLIALLVLCRQQRRRRRNAARRPWLPRLITWSARLRIARSEDGRTSARAQRLLLRPAGQPAASFAAGMIPRARPALV